MIVTIETKKLKDIERTIHNKAKFVTIDKGFVIIQCEKTKFVYAKNVVVGWEEKSDES